MSKEIVIQNDQVLQRQNTAEKNIKKISRSEKSVKAYQFFILKVLVLVAVIWVLFFKIVGLTHMPTQDMFPRVDSGDLVLFYRLDKDVRAQDIVVIEKDTPDSDKELFILRVAAAGGDTVDIDNGRLMINGNTVSEPNIFYTTNAYEGYTQFPITLAEDECFVLADQRNGGADSRYFGAVKKNEIQGTVISFLRRNNL